ncbi:putative F-box protein At3g16210 [Vicia villosa]|uniref:putative F-box protein At3g16210 n=1 Tax=Vicia villosa TaxID=3911 RepID=UPI00273C3C4C|nr:putative F-box protein At3g16210 [Vicia villosa]
MVTTNKHIHEDFAFVILSKLPLKSLTRFCCVSKSWSLLLDNTYFMNMFRKNFLLKNHSYYNDTSLLLHYDASWNVDNPSNSGMHSLSGEGFENMVHLDWSNLFQEDEWLFNILGSTSINGFLCIDCKQTGRVVLWNPTTEEYKVIPICHFSNESIVLHLCLHGFGFDSISDDYKVIQHRVFSHHDRDSEDATWKDICPYSLWEIYSLKNNSWKTLDIDMPTCYQDEVGVHAYMDNVCHWLGKSRTHGSTCEMHNEVYLVSFNLSTEMFVTTSLPSNMDGIDYNYLGVLNGSITLISNNAETTTFQISILGEVGRNESWIKLFIFQSLSCIDRPIGVSKNGDIFFIQNDEELAWINLSSEKFEKLGVKGTFNCQVISYKRSLVPIDRKK